MVEHEEEIRLALVMNGGVSLAVWMGGVTHEIDLLRRASDPRLSDATVRATDRPVVERWRDACAGSPGHPRRRVIVDVVAGTSAGGINGATLATAIARGTSLDPAPDAGTSETAADAPKLKNIWHSDAALRFTKLLPRRGTDPRPSLLDGDFFTRAVADLLKSFQEQETPAGAEAPQSQAVTLFVTATATGPDAHRYTDAFGNQLACPDHRRVYCFEKRVTHYTYQPDPLGNQPWDAAFTRTPRDDFRRPPTEDPSALVSAVRSSAAYPLAFAPVSSADIPAALLARGSAEPAWLMDGGVLDNAPFGPVLEAIANRELSGQVRRLLVYVVPSADVPTPAHDQAVAPAWTQILESAIQFPREADLRTDVEAIQSLLGQADGLGVDSRDFFAAVLDDPAQRETAATTAGLLLPTYRRGRITAAVFDARRLVAAASLAPTATAQAAENVGNAVPRWVPEVPAGGPADDLWQWGVAGAERTVRLFLRDLRRRLVEMRSLDDGPGETRVAHGLSQLSSHWLPRISAVKRACTERLREELAGMTDVPARDIVTAVNGLFDELRVRQVLTELVAEASRSYCTAAEPGLDPIDVLTCALNVEVISRAFQARSPAHTVAPFEFLRLGLDVPTPVLDQPLRARVRENAQSKLYGTQLAHFGAFGAAAWRDWDWLIGRLDAVAHLGRVLGKEEGWVRETQLEVLKSENVSLEELSGRMESMLDVSLATLMDELKELPAGQEVVRDLVDSLADGLRHLSHPPALRWPARLLAGLRLPLRGWLWIRGF